MFFLQTGDIIPNDRIGPVRLGMDRSEIASVSADFSVRRLPEYDLYVGGDIQIWLHRAANCVTQIMSYGSFGGKFAGQFGIGSYLCDVEDYLGEKAKEELDAYLFGSLAGICFELSDIEDDRDSEEWTRAPIECISIFRP